MPNTRSQSVNDTSIPNTNVQAGTVLVNAHQDSADVDQLGRTVGTTLEEAAAAEEESSCEEIDPVQKPLSLGKPRGTMLEEEENEDETSWEASDDPAAQDNSIQVWVSPAVGVVYSIHKGAVLSYAGLAAKLGFSLKCSLCKTPGHKITTCPQKHAVLQTKRGDRDENNDRDTEGEDLLCYCTGRFIDCS